MQVADFNLAAAKADHQTAKFNSPPNFPATCSYMHGIKAPKFYMSMHLLSSLPTHMID